MKLVNRTFFFLIIFTPLAFGTVHTWSVAAMEILGFSALVLFLFQAVKNRDSIYLPPGTLPLLLFLAFILLQIIPLPSPLVKWLSPSAFMIHQNAGAYSAPGDFLTLSIHPKATLSEFFRYLSYGAFYLLTVQLLKEKDMLRRTIVVITLFGALLSFSSILQFYLTKDMALWFWHVPINSMIVGPYICHNHYAGLMEMIFPVVLALFFFYRPRMGNTSVLKGIVEIVSQEKANIHLLIGLAALLIITSVFVSLSRGGMISLCLSLVFFTFLLFRRKISRGNTLAIIGIVVLAALSIGWFGWDQIFDRFARLKNAQGVIHELRFDFWLDSLNIIRDFSITGSGFGTYIDIYPSYQTVSGYLTIDHAHNDYIEMAIEGGMIGFLFAASFLVTLFFKTYRVFIQRRDAYCVYIYMGSITGVLSMLFHGFTDFNLHIGANGLWIFFMAGVAVSAANTAMASGSRTTRLLPVKSLFLKRVMLPVVLIVMAGGVVYNLSSLTGYYYFSHIRHFSPGARMPAEDLKKIIKIAGLAVKADPLNADYRFALANAALFLKDGETALGNFTRAVCLNPTNSLYLKRIGLYLEKTGEKEAAGRLLKAGVECDISDPENALQYGAWLLSQGKAGQGTGYIRTAVELNPKMIGKALTTMAIFALSDADMEKAVPEIPGPYISWAAFLYGQGKRTLAEAKYLKALDYIEEQKKIDRWAFYRIYQFFRTRGKIEQSLKVMQKAATVLPMDVGIRITLGDLYRQMGISYRAEQEYEQALLMDPGNREAKKRLSR
ncbi:MAG: O-antigen ligase family protein [Desulfobacterium sp.]|nr:O-antigen ligase family protein [Desulfobacterium sp.]